MIANLSVKVFRELNSMFFYIADLLNNADTPIFIEIISDVVKEAHVTSPLIISTADSNEIGGFWNNCGDPIC